MNEEAFRAYMERAAELLCGICHDDRDGAISRALAGRRLFGHHLLGPPGARRELKKLLHESLIQREAASEKVKRFQRAVARL